MNKFRIIINISSVLLLGFLLPQCGIQQSTTSNIKSVHLEFGNNLTKLLNGFGQKVEIPAFRDGEMIGYAVGNLRTRNWIVKEGKVTSFPTTDTITIGREGASNSIRFKGLFWGKTDDELIKFIKEGMTIGGWNLLDTAAETQLAEGAQILTNSKKYLDYKASGIKSAAGEAKSVFRNMDEATSNLELNMIRNQQIRSLVKNGALVFATTGALVLVYQGYKIFLTPDETGELKSIDVQPHLSESTE